MANSSRIALRHGLSNRVRHSSKLHACGKRLASPQFKLAYMQAFSIVIGTIITMWLASEGFDTVSLLVYQKIEVFAMSIPMHILTLHLSHEDVEKVAAR